MLTEKQKTWICSDEAPDDMMIDTRDLRDLIIAARRTTPSVSVPEAARVLLDELHADAGYLFGRVAADGSVAVLMASSVRTKVDAIKAAFAEASFVSTHPGYKLVPIEPTQEMIDEGKLSLKERATYDFRSHYAAMLAAAPSPPAAQQFDFVAHLARQAEWSCRTFGPGGRVDGVTDHIAKELVEVRESGGDLKEWVDCIILSLDGAWRSGATPQQIIDAIVAKQAKNEARNWPDWRTAPPGKAIEHDRSGESTAPAALDAQPVGYVSLGAIDLMLVERTDETLPQHTAHLLPRPIEGFDIPLYTAPPAPAKVDVDDAMVERALDSGGNVKLRDLIDYGDPSIARKIVKDALTAALNGNGDSHG